MANISILLVDDRVTILDSIKSFFSEFEIKPTLYSACNEDEALSMLEGSCKVFPVPKIVLIDVNRTKDEGMHLLNTLRSHPDLKSMLVFVITNSVSQSNKLAALNLNIAGYIPITFGVQELNNCFSVLNDYWNIIEL